MLFCLGCSCCCCCRCYSRLVSSYVYTVCVPWKPSEEKLINILLIFQQTRTVRKSLNSLPSCCCARSRSLLRHSLLREILADGYMDSVFVTFLYYRVVPNLYESLPSMVICLSDLCENHFSLLSDFFSFQKLFRNVFCFGQDLSKNSLAQRRSASAHSNISQWTEWRWNIRPKMKTSAFSRLNCYLFWWTGTTLSDNNALGWWWNVGAKKRLQKKNQ